MPIEAKDNLLVSAFKIRNPRKLFAGARSWSPLESARTLSVEGLDQNCRAETVSNEGNETLRYQQVVIERGRYRTVREIKAQGDEINEPNRPWAKKVRHINS